MKTLLIFLLSCGIASAQNILTKPSGSVITDSASLRALLSDETGSGAAVFATSPTLVTPLLGTPTSGTLTNCTGLPQAGTVGLTTTDRPQFANVRITHSTLTYAASVAVDFDADGFKTVTLAGDIEFTTSNLAAGRSKTIRIVGDSSTRAFTFPASWKFVGAAAPASLAANKVAILTLTSFGTTDADVIAAYAAEP